MQGVANCSNDEITQRHTYKIPREYGLIVDQCACIEGHNAHHAGFAFINTHKCSKLEEYQKQRCRAENLPEHTLKQQMRVAVGNVVSSGRKYFISSPAKHDCNYKVRNY